MFFSFVYRESPFILRDYDKNKRSLLRYLRQGYSDTYKFERNLSFLCVRCRHFTVTPKRSRNQNSHHACGAFIILKPPSPPSIGWFVCNLCSSQWPPCSPLFINLHTSCPIRTTSRVVNKNNDKTTSTCHHLSYLCDAPLKFTPAVAQNFVPVYLQGLRSL